MPAVTPDLVHHLYEHPGDLLPHCGVKPGPDALTGSRHTGHERGKPLTMDEQS